MVAQGGKQSREWDIENSSGNYQIDNLTNRFLPFIKDSLHGVLTFLPISDTKILAEIISDEIEEAIKNIKENFKDQPEKSTKDESTQKTDEKITNDANEMIDSVGQNSQQPTQPQDMLEKELNKSWQDDGKEGATEAMKKLTDSGWQNDTAKPTKKQIDPEEQLYQDFEADLDKEYADDTESTDKPDQNKEDNEKKEETDEDAPDDDYTYGKANGLPTKQNADTNQEAAPEQEKKQQTA